MHVLVIPTIAGWSSTAHASGHALGGLDALVPVVALVMSVPWIISWWLATRTWSTGRWFGGTLLGTAFMPAALFFGADMDFAEEVILLVFAASPSLAHQGRLIAHLWRKGRSGKDSVS